MPRTSTCRNNPDVETFLFYQRERRCLSTRSLETGLNIICTRLPRQCKVVKVHIAGAQDEISVSLGADPKFAMELLEADKGGNDHAGGHAPPSRSNSNQNVNGETLPPTPNPKSENTDPPKKKARPAKPQACKNLQVPIACV